MDTDAPSKPPFRWRLGAGAGLALAVVALAFWWIAGPVDPATSEVRRVLNLVRRDERGERVSTGRLAFLKNLPGPLAALSRLMFGDGNARYTAAEMLARQGTNAEPALIAALRVDRSPGVRLVAAEALGSINGPLGFAALTNAATVDASAEVRGAAVDALVTLEREDAVPVLLAGIARETNEPPRSQFVTALGSLGSSNHVRLLANLATNDPSGEVRAAAVTGVAELGGLAWAEFLESVLLRDSASNVRSSTIRQIGRLDRPESLTVLTNLLVQDTDSELRYWLAEALESLADPRSVPAVLSFLARTNAPAKASHIVVPDDPGQPLVRLLGVIGDRAATPVLTAMLARTNNDDSLQVELLEAVARMEGTNAFDLVLRFLAAPGPGVTPDSPPAPNPPALPLRGRLGSDTLRQAAARTLGNIGDTRAVAPLLAALTNGPSSAVAAEVAMALGHLEQTNATPALRKLAHNPDQLVRSAAVEALANLADPAAVDLCLAALRLTPPASSPDALPSQPNPDLYSGRIRAARSLALFSQPRVITALSAALADEDSNLAEEAAWSLGHLRAVAAVPALTGALTNREPRVQFAAAIALGQTGATNAIPALTRLLRGGDPAGRLAAALGLAWLGNTNGLPFLERASQSRGEWQRFAGLIGLIRLATPSARAGLENAAVQDASPHQRLAQAGLQKPDAQALVPMLAERNKSIRLYAVRALLMFADPATLPALRNACLDRDPETRDAARLAVRRLGAEVEAEKPVSPSQ